MNEIKPYKPMWYLVTHGNEPKYYYLPMSDIKIIMETLGKSNAPKYLDLTEYWYGRESCSMIRWANSIDDTASQLQFELLKYPIDIREKAALILKQRKEEGLSITMGVLMNIVDNLSDK